MKCCAFFAKFFYFFSGLVFCWVDGEEGLEAKASARWRKRLVMVWSGVFVCYGEGGNPTDRKWAGVRTFHYCYRWRPVDFFDFSSFF